MSSNIKYDGFYKDFLDGRVAMTTNDSVFSNTDCLFCELNDIIVPTWLSVICHFLRARPKEVEELLDLDKVAYLDGEELIRWYALRKNRNALLDLKREGVGDDLIIALGADMFNTKYAYYNNEGRPFLLNYAYTLTKTIRTASIMIKKFVIYTEQCNKEVDNFLTNLYGNKVEIRSGDFAAAVSNISNNSTFVLSDIFKVQGMIDAGIIKGSSIILADGYAYNYNSKPGYDSDLKIDVEKLSDSLDFKFNTFNNFTD